MSDWKKSLHQLVPQSWRGAGKQRNQRSNVDAAEDSRIVVTDAERRLPEREESLYWAWQYPGSW